MDGDDTIMIVRSSGLGLFSQPAFETGKSTMSIVTARFRTSTTLLDIGLADRTAKQGRTHKNVGDGSSLLNPTNIGVHQVYGVGAGTLNLEDTYRDLAVACPVDQAGLSACSVRVLLGENDGTFQDTVKIVDLIEPEGKPCALKVADLDKDGRQDIVVGITARHKLGLLRNVSSQSQENGFGGGMGDGGDEDHETDGHR